MHEQVFYRNIKDVAEWSAEDFIVWWVRQFGSGKGPKPEDAQTRVKEMCVKERGRLKSIVGDMHYDCCGDTVDA